MRRALYKHFVLSLGLLTLVACTQAEATLTPIPTLSHTPTLTPIATPTASPTLTSTPTPTSTSVQTSRKVALPQDDAPHSDVNTEWWYYNGHLKSSDGKRYAFHYAVFQVLLPDRRMANVAHLSVSDLQEDTYITDQRVSFATRRPDDTLGFDFDLRDWRLSGYDGTDRISVSTGDYTLNLNLENKKQPVLHQHTGLVDFGSVGKSYYYSRTRMVASGAVTVGGEKIEVTGLAWFDHQWGNFQPLAIGWDWFAIQLVDGSEIMLTLLRDEEGQQLQSYGTFVAPDSTIIHLPGEEFRILATDSWTSPNSGAVYPMGWRIHIPERDIDLTLKPTVKESEFDATLTTRNYYWEGGVVVSGSHAGEGFVELTGYAPILFSSTSEASS